MIEGETIMYLIEARTDGRTWEEVDSADTLSEAEFLQREYVLAFNTMAVRIVRVSEVSHA